MLKPTEADNTVYNSTTTMTNEEKKELNGKENFLQKIMNNISNKPVKKIYRIGLFILVILVLNNTNSNNVSDLLSNVMQQNICQNFTESINNL